MIRDDFPVCCAGSATGDERFRLRPTNDSPSLANLEQQQKRELVQEMRYREMLASNANWQRPNAIPQGVVVEVQQYSLLVAANRRPRPPISLKQQRKRELIREMSYREMLSSYANWQRSKAIPQGIVVEQALLTTSRRRLPTLSPTTIKGEIDMGCEIWEAVVSYANSQGPKAIP